MEERRIHPRIRRRQKVALFLSDGSVEYLWSYNLSRGGMQVHTPHLVDVGTRFRIATAIFDQDVEVYATAYIQVEVVHKIYDGEFQSFRLGMRFISFEGDSRDLYLSFIRKLELLQT